MASKSSSATSNDRPQCRACKQQLRDSALENSRAVTDTTAPALWEELEEKKEQPEKMEMLIGARVCGKCNANLKRAAVRVNNSTRYVCIEGLRIGAFATSTDSSRLWIVVCAQASFRNVRTESKCSRHSGAPESH